MHALRRTGGRYGLATMCIGVGQGIALIVERLGLGIAMPTAGHRATGAPPGHAHENSPAAFRRAVELGADGVELDIHATSDGALLVHHDADVPGVGRIAANIPLPPSPGTGCRTAKPIPTLAEASTLLRGLDVWVEVKTLPPRWTPRCWPTLDAGPTPEQYAVHAFDHRIIARLGDRRPELRRGVLLASYLLDTLAVLQAAGADTLWMETHLIDACPGRGASRSADSSSSRGPRTTSREIRRLTRLGVDGICGNYPDRIRPALT